MARGKGTGQKPGDKASAGAGVKRAGAARPAKPVCAKCKKRTAINGFSRCEACRDSERQYWRRVRKTRLRQNACPSCGKPAARGKRYCAAHLAYHAQAAREYRKRQRRAAAKNAS